MTSPIMRGRAWPAAALVVTAALVALGTVPAAAAPAAPRATWKTVKIIKAAGFSLGDISTLPGDEAWVTGGAGTPSSAPLFYNRAAGAWVRLPRPAVAAGSEFGGDVSANLDTNAWGVIENGAAVDHWNGHGWHRFAWAPGTGINGVLAFGKNRARVFTFDFTSKTESVRLYDGHTWTTKALPAEIDGDSIANLTGQSSGSSIWAWSLDPAHNRWQTLHFDGKKWTIVAIPKGIVPSTGGPAQILALSHADVWGTIAANNGSGPIVLVHWDGTAWKKIGGAPPGELLGAIASDGQGGVWMYAARPISKAPFLKPFFVHYLKGKWTTAAAPVSSLGFVSISSMALIPGSTRLWAVGTIQQPLTNIAGIIEQFSP